MDFVFLAFEIINFSKMTFGILVLVFCPVISYTTVKPCYNAIQGNMPEARYMGDSVICVICLTSVNRYKGVLA